MTEKQNSILEGTITVLYGFLIMILTLLGLFFFKGVEEVELFEKATFYWITLAIGLITVLALAALEYFVSSGVLSKEKFGWAKLFIWEPEESLIGSIGLGKYITVSNVIHISVILSLFYGLLAVSTQTFFIALPPYELQVSETGQLILNTEPAAISETLTIVLLVSLIYGIGNWYFWRLGISNIGSKIVVYLVMIVLIVLFWVALHTVRYKTSIAIGYTAVFGFVSSASIALIGSPIFLYLLHVSNNVFLKASDVFAHSNVKIFIIVLLVIYISTLIGVKVYKLIKK